MRQGRGDILLLFFYHGEVGSPPPESVCECVCVCVCVGVLGGQIVSRARVGRGVVEAPDERMPPPSRQSENVYRQGGSWERP